ncbi:hypothetical protein [Leptolyngbya sp. 7M]|uniref:hypothetical protein n=1 Tax=Leptolyngbya sp. 7M TaxID=2812896 RepID=UPI001B8B7C7A|nr:hypothetical protein [Leptolyngbya sp. 7M]QYO64046.1 hypothetical protein JVX88_30375 [Leptolyngbya sp. 7M]
MHFSSAYLLVSHGSRDPRPEIALEHLAELVRQRLQARRQRQGQSLAVGREVWRQEQIQNPAPPAQGFGFYV